MDRKFGFDSINDEILQSQIKAIWKSKIFIGRYIEKRLEPIQSYYRDVIVVDRKIETEFFQNLDQLLIQLHEHYSIQIIKNHLYIGIVRKDDDTYNINTELDEPIPFGSFWFQIRTIKFRPDEIQLKLKCIRPVKDFELGKSSFSEKLKAAMEEGTIKKGEGENLDVQLNDVVRQWQALFKFWQREISEFTVWLLSISINRTTIKESLRFIFLIIISLFAGSTKIVKYIGIFSIKLIEHITWLAHILTPAFLALLDLLSKIIGGFYLLIAMIWRDSVNVRRPHPENAIEAGPRKTQQAIRYEHY